MAAGGAESAVTRLGIAGFASMKALSTEYNETPEKASRPWDRDRDGFVMGEGGVGGGGWWVWRFGDCGCSGREGVSEHFGVDDVSGGVVRCADVQVVWITGSRATDVELSVREARFLELQSDH